jgi:calcineurin-like phosphoesterase family protein
MENAFNTSVEVNDYKPVSFEELIENNAIFRAEL